MAARRKATATKKKPSKRKARPPVPAETLKPETELADPGPIHTIYFSSAQTGGVRVDEDTALTFAAVWACVKVISEDLGALPWRVLKARANGGSDPQPLHPVDWLLHHQANPETDAFTFKQTLVSHALTWGNGYAEIERDGAGRPVWYWQLTPDRVDVTRDLRGRLVYDVSNSGGQPNTPLYAADVFHLKGPGFDGLIGYSPIALGARVIGAGISMNQSTNDFWANDSTPGGLLEHPGKLSEGARKNLRESWEFRHQGPRNRRRLAILEEGMKWAQTALPQETARLIESEYLTIEDVCRIFRVPPHKIMHLLRSTYSNIEHQGIEYVVDCLTPWAVRMEQEANVKFFGRQQRGLFFTKLNLKGRLRGDTAAQTQHLREMLDRGVYDIDEARDYLDLNPIPDGDKRFVPLNMQLLEKAGEEPPPPKSPPPGTDPAQDDDESEQQDDDKAQSSGEPAQERMQSALRGVLVEACQRIARREQHRGEDATKRLAAEPERFAAWVDGFLGEHGGFCAVAIRPGAAALAQALGLDDEALTFTLDWFMTQRLKRLRERQADQWTAAEDGAGMADALIERFRQAASMVRSTA